jgi:hypothetical protein
MQSRWTALFVAGTMIASLTGCLGGGSNQPTASSGSYGTVNLPPQRKPGMSTKQKLVLLAGAAALAYLYNKNKNNKGVGPQGQYYRSKNGRVYYRDAQGNAHWVSPPQGGLQVPASDARQYLSDEEYSRYVGNSSAP